MKIYIDDEFHVFTEPVEGLTEVETGFFDGKCVEYIEGFRFVPDGRSWIREDGAVFNGQMGAPYKELDKLEKAQANYEHEQLFSVTEERDELLNDMAQMIEEVYASDMEMMGL